tara:strand:+ start:232 stop:1050 length:819 start_codon:yes stop_codon:yes gene_type:complete
MDHIIEKNKRERKGRVYFSKETEAAIVKYNSLDSVENADERSDIYQDHIHYPFFKLTQNIIHTFKFYYTEVENLEHLQHELITFLLSKIHLFNPENGAKAYSYFGTIVKRWLIVYNTKNYGKKIQNIQINDLANYSNLDSTDPGFISSQKMDESVDKVIEGAFEGDELSNQGYKYEDKLSIFIDKYVIECTERIYEIFPKGNDAKIADAILELFRKRDAIDVFNKKALYIYIREMIDVKTPKITKIANVLYGIFKKKYLFYLEQGYYPTSKV